MFYAATQPFWNLGCITTNPVENMNGWTTLHGNLLMKYFSRNKKCHCYSGTTERKRMTRIRFHLVKKMTIHISMAVYPVFSYPAPESGPNYCTDQSEG